jgi:hypothetical protein
MSRIPAPTREKALRLRIERRSLAEVSRETGVSKRSLLRLENGWIDAEGRRHSGWKPKLEKAWKDLVEGELACGLMLKEERLKTYQELARLAVAKVKEMFPLIRTKSAADVKALLSEIRELCRLIAEEKGEFRPNPQTLVAVKTDITVNELADRYRDAHADRQEGDAEPGGTAEVADDDGGVSPGADGFGKRETDPPDGLPDPAPAG